MLEMRIPPRILKESPPAQQVESLFQQLTLPEPASILYHVPAEVGLMVLESHLLQSQEEAGKQRAPLISPAGNGRPPRVLQSVRYQCIDARPGVPLQLFALLLLDRCGARHPVDGTQNIHGQNTFVGLLGTLTV